MDTHPAGLPLLQSTAQPTTQSTAQSIARRCAAWMVVLTIPLFFSGCGTFFKLEKSEEKTAKPSSVSTLFGGKKKGGGYYLDDGPGDNPPADLHLIPDAIPREEPLRASTMRPYSALGKRYKPMTRHEPYKTRGMASWYGRRYHGQKTASGEVYDMYAMTAAHPTLPIPSYARVTSVASGKSVVVRVNDRGPFLSNRLIDLSYTAAYKLDVLGGGSGLVEVESIVPGTGSFTRLAAAAPAQRVSSTSSTSRSPSGSSASPNPNGQAGTIADQSVAVITTTEPDSTEAQPGLFQAAFAPAVADTPTASPTGDGAPLSSPETPAAVPAGIYLQLGAFNAYDNADNFVVRMRNELPSLMTSLDIIAKDGLFKVHAGPYPDRALARKAADKIAEALSIRPVLLTR
ncbi:rare lipoprotein A [Nitrosospira multiformis]|uniref:Endolytic peptidoglycan transglycosylase RlpA n=1 Tax=Nitrosospira multiformis TaxID=1231 RepID=A0A1H8DPU8_9PROT|nr:septal ring lytic transglycosylase RlpA family protein [Nitrosospira multiformis]SEN09361.1 rare lipoprotein A [Nitrosospira multiformis]